jgi:hypothetical protein
MRCSLAFAAFRALRVNLKAIELEIQFALLADASRAME